VDINIVREDMRDLTELYKSGLLKKRYYIRDNMKILALCETLGIQFPGDRTIADRINIKYITEAIDDPDDMPDSPEEDDFDDLPDDEDFNDGDELYYRFGDGTEIILWNNASEQSYGIQLAGRPSEEVSDIDILECLLEHRSEASDWLQYIAERIETARAYLNNSLTNLLSPSQYLSDAEKECHLLLNIINGRATMPSTKSDRLNLARALSDLAALYGAFEELGAVR
jgi:hypothetical protein